MGFFDKVKTSFDDDISEKKTEEKKSENYENEIKSETKKEEKIENKTKTKTSAPKTVITKPSTLWEVEDNFLSALNKNIIKSDKPKEEKKPEIKENKTEEKEEENKIKEKEDVKPLFQDQIEEKKEEIKKEENPEIKTNISWDAKISIDEILDLAIENWVSDVHFSEWWKIALRINWSIRFINEIEEVENKEMEEYVKTLLWNDKDLLERYKTTKEMDCAY